MRVGLIIYGSLDTISGGFLYDRKLVEHLRGCGDEVEVISMRWRSYPGCLADNLSRALYSRVRGLRLDIMLQDELNHPSLFWLNRRLGVRPIISIVHHLRSSERRPQWRNLLYRWVEARYLRTVDGFVFNSETTRAEVEKLLERPTPSVVAFPAGDRFAIDLTPAQVEARALAPGPLRILFLGNVIPRKELHTLITALSLLPALEVGREEWRLDVVGSLSADAAYAKSIRSQISRLGLEDKVALRGILDEGALAECLSQSHLVAVPSTYEGFGIAYLEGMGFGLPAIATTVGAAREIIEDEGNGFLVPPGDAEALAARIAQLSRDRKLLARMGRAAMSSFAAHPTWRDTTSSIRKFLCAAAG